MPATMPPSADKNPKVGSVGRRLTPCDACNMFCPRVYIAACGHAYCVGCAVVQQEEHGQLRVMCNECKRRVIADLVEMKDQLVVRDLPFALCPGRVHLKPLGGLGRRLTPCDACNMFSPRVYLCACGHAFCTGCAIVHKEEEEGAGLKAFCLECKKKVTTDLIEIKPSLLRQMRFVCSCGREGTLEQIKEHLWESAESHNVTDVASKGSIDGPFGAESLLHSLRDEVLSLKLQLRTLVGVATKKYFWVDLQKIIDEHEKSRQKTITSNVEQWEVCGYACGFFCQISEHDNECYVDVFVRTMSNNTSLAPWPIKKRCIFALYDISGREVKTHVSLFFQNGRPMNSCFIAPSFEAVAGFGPTKFVRVADIRDRSDELLFEGRACFSAELQEL